MSPSLFSPDKQTSPIVSARSTRIQRIKDRLVQLQQEYHAGILGGEETDGEVVR
ncbi:hypothetical protein Pmar_PMAR005668 [Perkinsus marinus ATCC 50983]|uniref:Uncharacterized protein n=1 Tax=Perkinsus marinus (strain ATCC 50983 / TXsc) TaxID=423536 RepID=C5LKL6_PERM5|nr:hypothetical protein Pmar_PMAR015170 [Perkinsus marinus ATCC 50983]XP_002770911.1 hypothetical protein Pmar_PMAR005668 [Perkinsus marinus ATCC 50983]EEQ99054.1 hypothetical protein Pmar_PMAR015170 [Perkinsus marinus ATCC 50983]EER02727.1 hypothetical protein Pmar_PMAR005668 [Perkinsus marinus ATCC 50983]|eukprot:XP_002766337.1 hypothetical protein Pmar_PMAR015170 [Perkinsus marinus ATCC 50983]